MFQRQCYPDSIAGGNMRLQSPSWRVRRFCHRDQWRAVDAVQLGAGRSLDNRQVVAAVVGTDGERNA